MARPLQGCRSELPKKFGIKLFMCMGEKYVEKVSKNRASISDNTTAESSERTHSVFDAYHDSASESEESLDDECDNNYYNTIRRYVKKC